MDVRHSSRDSQESRRRFRERSSLYRLDQTPTEFVGGDEAARWGISLPRIPRTPRNLEGSLLSRREGRLMETKTCENCGLPSWAISGPGVAVTVEAKPENRFQRTRKRTIWCHSDECAVQRLGIALYGRVTHKWPITLAQFRATKPLEQRRPRPASLKRTRASRKAKDLLWGTSEAMPTAKISNSASLESMA